MILVLLVQQVLLVLKDLKVILVLLVQQALLVRKDLKVILVQRVLLVLKEILVL